MILNDKIFIPETMKSVKNWCAWRLGLRNGKQTKVPYQTNGQRASSTDRDTWASFDDITRLLAVDNRYCGYGFMLGNGFAFCDIDHCISDDGTIDSRGASILDAFPLSFCEISQSGHGLHIITRGTVQRCFNNRKAGVELYDNGRFCAVTGRSIRALEPTEEQAGLDFVFHKYATHSATNKGIPMTGNSRNSDSWIIRHASAVTGQQGRDFRTLFSGDTSAYESASEADSALCTLLAFWCDRDFSQIDRLFRLSGLYRCKWEREDYRNRTIRHACERLPETISEWMKRKYDESCQSASAMQILAFGKRDDDSE